MSEKRTIPFHYGLYYNAMVNLLGREPDFRYRQGYDGYYSFRYEPKDEAEANKLAENASVLQDWLLNFDIIPFRSECYYGRLHQPQKGQENKDYLVVAIVHPVKKKT